MRAVLLAVLITGLAAPVFAHPHDPDWRRRANVEAMEREADRARAAALERETRAREQRAPTEATIRAMRDGELAGGPSATGMTWRLPVLPEPSPPRTLESAPVPELTDDAARMDALMAEAMARSTARIRAITGGRPR
ncbi:MAG: hypothetical protein Q8J89_01180 [Caulobacter sp.]|nr:hypothetical protein [Caulobacter sp.]